MLYLAREAQIRCRILALGEDLHTWILGARLRQRGSRFIRERENLKKGVAFADESGGERSIA